MKFTIPTVLDEDKLEFKYTYCTCTYNEKEQIITISIDDTDISEDRKVVEKGDALVKLNKHYISTENLLKFKKNFSNENWTFMPFVTSLAAKVYIGEKILVKYAK